MFRYIYLFVAKNEKKKERGKPKNEKKRYVIWFTPSFYLNKHD